MFSTYKIMSAHPCKELQDKTLEDLCLEYNQTTNMKLKNNIYRTMYCKLFPMMLNVQKNYPTLSNEQKVEVTMFILISTLRCYKGIEKERTKFSTYYCTNLKNGMVTVINSMKCHKRCVWMNMIDNAETVSYVLSTQKDKETETTNNYFLDNLKSSKYLSTLEKEYCGCVLAGYTKLDELSELLDLNNRETIYDKKKTVKRKQLFELKQSGTTNPITYTPPTPEEDPTYNKKVKGLMCLMDKSKSQKLTDKQKDFCQKLVNQLTPEQYMYESERLAKAEEQKKKNTKILRKLKKSVQEKLEKYGRELFNV